MVEKGVKVDIAENLFFTYPTVSTSALNQDTEAIVSLSYTIAMAVCSLSASVIAPYLRGPLCSPDRLWLPIT